MRFKQVRDQPPASDGVRWNATTESNFSSERSSATTRRHIEYMRFVWRCLAVIAVYIFTTNVIFKSRSLTQQTNSFYSPDVLARCRSLNVKPGPPSNFNSRRESDRFQQGTRPTLITNATVWTGGEDGTEVLQCTDVLVDRGLLKWIGDCGTSANITEPFGSHVAFLDAKGAWLTPGIVDLHSHLAVGPAPALAGAEDGNSLKGPTQPWLRSLDGLNTHDDAFGLAIAGGVTTSLILPGSANAIGGQAFVMKLRPTKERSPTSMLLEPPFGLNGSEVNYDVPPRWRHMKHACGENPSQAYSQTRMDTFWQFRQAYEAARQIKEKQDDFCDMAIKGDPVGNSKFPDSLQWEALVDVLRGKVKVQTHCYEAVDLDDFVRLSNEFRFPIAAFHHAHETYLVPDVLKRAYGDVPPASAMFASFSRYKRESYRHSEFAPKILHDNGLRVVMKSDHSAIVSRYLLHEAQQAHYYGLPSNIALKSVITTPAQVMGLDHRIGYVREGFDADIVLWDSHPLQLGATPIQVFIDGIPQLSAPHHINKPSELQKVPITPDFEKEAADAVRFEGLPPLAAKEQHADTVIFTNVSSIWTRGDGKIAKLYAGNGAKDGAAVVRDGQMICAGSLRSCSAFLDAGNASLVDLSGGSISPGLVSYGTNLGLQEIAMEVSTTDGAVWDPLERDIPSLLGGEGAVVRAADGLQFSTRDALLAYRAGVASAITPPLHYGLLGGVGVYFSTGAEHRLVKGAVIQDVVGLHVAISRRGQPSVSTQVAALRKILIGKHEGELGRHVQRVLDGEIPLVVDIHSADAIATLLALKKEVESSIGSSIKLTIAGGSEAHVLAKEISEAGVGVILNPVRPYPYTWNTRRILPGPPISQDSALVHLLKHNITVGLGVMGINMSPAISTWSARNARFDLAWATVEAGGLVSKEEALALSSINTEKLLGVTQSVSRQGDLVATHGGDMFDLQSKIVAIISPRRAQVELL